MALTLENGTGVQGADSYASQAYILSHWAARPHDPVAATVAAADADNLDGAAREATAYIDATWGGFYKGQRRGYVQGLLWPRTGAKDAAGYDLPDLPEELKRATAELAGRAISARLAADNVRSGAVKRTKEAIGPLSEETEYFEGAPSRTEYGIVAGILEPLLNGAQPGASSGSWAWA